MNLIIKSMIMSIFFLFNLDSKVVNTSDEYLDSLLINFSIEDTSHQSNLKQFVDRLYPYGDLMFLEKKAGDINSKAILYMVEKTDDQKIITIKCLLEKKGFFSIHEVLIPDEVKLVLDNINAKLVFEINDHKDLQNDFYNLLIPCGSHLSVIKDNIPKFEQIINDKRMSEVFSHYKFLFDYKYDTLQSIDTLGSNYNPIYNKKIVKKVYLVKSESLLDNSHIDTVHPYKNKSGEHFCQIVLNKAGKTFLSSLTKRYLNHFLSIAIDDTVYSCPQIYQQCNNGKIEISNLNKFNNLLISFILNSNILNTKMTVHSIDKKRN